MIPTPAVRCGGQHLLERLQPERVQDDLHRRDARSRDRGERLVARLDADAVGRDPPLGDERVEVVEQRVVRDHRARRTVQLHEVERREAEVLARAVDPRAEVARACSSRAAGRARRPIFVATNGRRVAEPRDDAPDDPLAASVAVDVGRVDEGDALGERGLERRRRVGLGHVAPVGSELPGPEPDARDRPAEPFDRPLLHRSSVAGAALHLASYTPSIAFTGSHLPGGPA